MCVCLCAHIYVVDRTSNVVGQPMTERIEKPKIIERTKYAHTFCQWKEYGEGALRSERTAREKC